jgi:uncharacterized protein (TIGR03067 family)
MFFITLLTLLLVPTAQTTPAADNAKKLQDQMQGDWRVVSFNGQAVPANAEAYLVFKGDKYEQWTNNAVDERGTVKLDGSTKPISIDFVITEGNDAGKLQLGLVELTGDTLSLAFAAPGNPTRPKTPNDAEVYATLTKSKSK